ncbi:TPA: hypothetical protein MIR06_26415 [Klebsiella pneumoniae]|nr:hypothetical protein CE636_02605 [Klebsiella sp. LY]PCE38424.1 hypothetical protein CI706_05790 [Klebsiella pneumoniae subsp. pneumoniae]QHP39530.1 hypothetical protein DRB03_26985 [Klebsiella pneumoniae]TNJ89044.1 hypothetical protein CI663_026830 [Klebsiella quasipneumoniae subsp. similipneumoniae]HBX6011805.1 hypothetical protein [Klebsiella pneumoniae]
MWCFTKPWPSTKLTCSPQRMENSSCAERKNYLPERFLFASSPVRSLRSVTWLRRALPDSNSMLHAAVGAYNDVVSRQ